MRFKERLEQYRFIKKELRYCNNRIAYEKLKKEIYEIECIIASIQDSRVRQAIYMRYILPDVKSWKQIGAVLNYSEGQIRRLCRRWLEKL